MRIGVVSDTHNNLKNVARIVELFNDAGVDRVIHTGDITRPGTLEHFATLEAPLLGVYGNNDMGERRELEAAARRLGCEFVLPPLDLFWHGRRLLVVHDPLEFDGQLTAGHEIALHGHTHRRRLEWIEGRLWFNPGESAGHMRGLNAVGVLDLETLEADILHF